MIIFYEIPILAVVFVIAAVLSLELGPIFTTVGIIGLLVGILFVLASDKDERKGTAFLFVLPNVLIIILGMMLGDQTVWDILF